MIDFRVCELTHCKSLIEDLTEVLHGYNTDEDKSYAPLYNKNMGYRLNDCMAIYVLTKISSDGESTVSVHFMEDPREDLEIHFEEDGYYKITKILIPTVQILSNESFMDDDIWPQYGKMRYFYYPPLCKFFKIVPTKYQDYIIRGKLLYKDEEDGLYKEPTARITPQYLMIDNKRMFVDILEKHGEQILDEDGYPVILTESKTPGSYEEYVGSEESERNQYALFDLDSFEKRWIDTNICFKWDVPVKPQFPFLPEIEGYEYIPVEVDEIIEGCDGWITTIRETKEMFVLCKFRECVFRRNSEFLKDCPCDCIKDSSKDGLHTIMWLNSSLQVLEFLVHCERFIEAMQLLEQLNVCGGPCAEFKRDSKKGCGCGRK